MPEQDGRPRHFAIATPHVAATQAGQAAFDAGGNAVDAALAAACTLTVVYPHMCAVGGDVMALVHDGAAHAVNGSGRAPLAPVTRHGRERAGTERGHDHRPRRGLRLAGHGVRWGRRPLAAATEPAAELASAGVPVAPSLARALAADRAL